MRIRINSQEFNIEIANTFFKKWIGLMGKKKIEKGMFFPKTKSIHTFFMKENIDVIMINKDYKIIHYAKNVPKNKIIIKKEAYHTIELPANSLLDVQINDELIID